MRYKASNPSVLPIINIGVKPILSALLPQFSIHWHKATAHNQNTIRSPCLHNQKFCDEGFVIMV